MADLRDQCCAEAIHSILPEGAAQLGIQLTADQMSSFVRLCHMLLASNREFNLTSITEPEAVVRRHFLDSLSLLPALRCNGDEPLAVVDVGAGAGFPGLPLAAVRPLWRFTEIESTTKKAAFVARAAQNLGLDNVSVAVSRAEAYAIAEGRDSFDLAVIRAVGATPVAIELAAPLVRGGGFIALYKSGAPETELRAAGPALTALGCKIILVHHVPAEIGVGEDRFLILLTKLGPTPAGFPRRPGMARKRPLR